mmetsp:Transcript_43543/g.75720  ORF Transcript_43543/g.75720 Transcript_43543/m.75720 type:complete len:237 (-) Transcript_43543:389-1099(-)
MLVLSPPDDWVTGGTGDWLLRVLWVVLDATATGAAVLCDAPRPAKLVLLVLGVRFGVNVGVVAEEAVWLWEDPLRLLDATGAFWMALAVITNGTGDADEAVAGAVTGAVPSTGVLLVVDTLDSCTGESFGLVWSSSALASVLLVAPSRGVPQLIMVEVSESVFGESLSASIILLLTAVRVVFAIIWVLSILVSSSSVEVTGVVRIGSTTAVRLTGLVKSNEASKVATEPLGEGDSL